VESGNLTPCRCSQILEEVIKFRWGALPDEQRIGIRNYVSNLVIKISTNEVLFRQEKMFLNKLNVILVQVTGSYVVESA
jgi:exportin-1